MREKFRLHQKGVGAIWLLPVLLVIVLLLLFPRGCPGPQGIDVRQYAQLHSLDAALGLFNEEFGMYPPSDANDSTGRPYCGAMKLAEAIMGKDLFGFHQDSGFRADGLDPNGGLTLYPGNPPTDNLEARKGPYLQPENANAYRLVDIYGKGRTGPFPENVYVLCDTFERKRPSGKKTGMPILYFKANASGTSQAPNDPDNPGNIYHWRDNRALLELGVPGNPGVSHPLADPNRFYRNIQSDKIAGESRPVRADSYILISASWDGLYGTADDICNFEWKYRE